MNSQEIIKFLESLKFYGMSESIEGQSGKPYVSAFDPQSGTNICFYVGSSNQDIMKKIRYSRSQFVWPESEITKALAGARQRVKW